MPHLKEEISPAPQEKTKNLSKPHIVPQEIISNKGATTLTTPKKRHRLETNLKTPSESPIESPKNYLDNIPKRKEEIWTKLQTLVPDDIGKAKRNLSPRLPVETNTLQNFDNTQVTTRKKNRLEDFAITLQSKLAPENKSRRKKETVIKQEDGACRASVIKFPVPKKLSPEDQASLDVNVDEKPTGIFMPTVDLELHLASEVKVKQEEGEKSLDDMKTFMKVSMKFFLSIYCMSLFLYNYII